MAYRYRSRYKVRKLARKSKRNFVVTLFLIALLLYATLNWALPSLINGVGFVKNIIKPSMKVATETNLNSSLAPPVLNIPYEATNSAQIDIKGYGTPQSSVAIYLDDEKKDTVDVSSGGVFEFKDISLKLGTNNIYGKSIDEDNKESLPSKLIKIIYDNEKPLLNVKEPEDNKKIQGGDKKIKVAGSTEAGAQIFINESLIIVDQDGNFSSELPLNEGENNFNIKAVDKASNSTEVLRQVTYAP